MIGHLYTLLLAGKSQISTPVVVGSLAGRRQTTQITRTAAVVKKRTTNRQIAVRR